MSQARWRIVGPLVLFVVICGAGVYLAMSPSDNGDKTSTAKESGEQRAEKTAGKAAADKPAEKVAGSPAEKPADDEAAQTVPGPNATTDELVDALTELRGKQLTAVTQEEWVQQLTDRIDAVINISDRILNAKDADEEQTIAAMMGKASSYFTRGSMLGDETGLKRALAVAEKYSQDPREEVADVAKDLFQQLRIQGFGQMTVEERKAMVDELFAEIGDEGPSKLNLRPLLQLADQLEGGVPPEEGAAVLKRIADLLKTSKDEDIAEYAERLEGIARRLTLPGNKMELSGTTLDGKEFDWESYRGKVVLVDFWATWCGPCVAELPNVLDNYKKYHDKGFDVVAVNLDDDPDTVRAFLMKKKIPWTNLFPPDKKDRHWNNPIARYYGVQGIPTAILVDRDGIVISMHARGEKLGETLEGLLAAKPE